MGDALLGQDRAECCPGERIERRQHQARPAGERHHDIPKRRVEAERSKLQHP